jgi:hypothetical protein
MTATAMRMASALKGISVLIVEDDPDTLDLLYLGPSARQRGKSSHG